MVRPTDDAVCLKTPGFPKIPKIANTKIPGFQARYLQIASDFKLANQAKALPKGALRLADRGFFCLERLRQEDEQGIYWITRILIRRNAKSPTRKWTH